MRNVVTLISINSHQHKPELFWGILFLKLSMTLFAVYVYATFSPFLDAERYLNTGLESLYTSTLPVNTFFAELFYALLKKILILNIFVHIFISSFIAYIIWYVFRFEFDYINKFIFLLCLFLPHFLIWSGIVGKEALAIGGFFLLIKTCVEFTTNDKVKILPLFIGLSLSLIMRPQYAFCYVYLLIASALIAKSKIRIFSYLSPSFSFSIFLIGFAYTLISLVLFEEYYSAHLLKLMNTAERYFLNCETCNANRWDIEWELTSDFINNIGWGIPSSIIGPTLDEAINRPVIFPVFIEGIISLLIFSFIFFNIIRFAIYNPQYSSVIIWGFLPAVILGLLVNYPFGIFNGGSAIRYKQSLSPLLYFYPILLLGVIKKKKLLGDKNGNPLKNN